MENDRMTQGETRIDWHQGFFSALRLEFQAYQDALEFQIGLYPIR
jgi:hypothetical protein